MCKECDQSIDVHIGDAAAHISSRLKHSFSRVSHLYKPWFRQSVKWTMDRPRDTADQHRKDFDLVNPAVHNLALHGPLNDASNPVLGLATAVTKRIAAKGIGDVGSVSVPPCLCDVCADPHLLFAEVAAPTRHIPHVPRCRRCFKLYVSSNVLPTVMTRLILEFLLNTRVLKNVFGMQVFNGTCSEKATCFKLPSLERLSFFSYSLRCGAHATEVDIGNC